jgi:hypothetical protein
MARYGIDYYLVSYYGSDNPVHYDASPFTAKSNGYGSIQLNWVNPTGQWAKLKIVRNSYGFPVDAFDGIEIITTYNGNSPAVSVVDNFNLVPGAFYYYSIFIFSTVQYRWLKAGTATGLSVKNFGNSDKMYNYLPSTYKISDTFDATDSADNQDLYNFLSLFGFELDYEQSLTELLINRYNVEIVNGNLIPLMLNQFGLKFEPELGYQQSRVLLRNGIKFLQKKGTAEGLREYIKAFSSYAVPNPVSPPVLTQISTGEYAVSPSTVSTAPNPSLDGLTVGHNIMLDYNDSSFEEGMGNWIYDPAGSPATLSALLVDTATTMSITSNVATLDIGTHNYQVGTAVYVSNAPMAIFNTPLAPVTITAVTATTISYALTAADTPTTSALNLTNLPPTYTIVTPSPVPWAESTAPISFPNKQKGIFAVKNSGSSSQTLTVLCGTPTSVYKSIPVTASSWYTFSSYTAKGTTARTVTPIIKWYDRFGTFLSTSTGTGVSNNTTVFSSSYRPYVSAQAPSTAYFAIPGFTIASVGAASTNEYHYFDCAQFELSVSNASTSAPSSFDEARQIHITLKATRINELLNPDMVYSGTSFTPWSYTGATAAQDISNPEPGIHIYNITASSISSSVATITVDSYHDINISDKIYIPSVSGTGVTAANYTGERTVTAVGNNTISFATSGSTQASLATTGTAYSEGHAMKLTATATSVVLKSYTTNDQMCGIFYPNTSYTFSIYGIVGSGTEQVTPKIIWLNTSRSVISTSTGTPTTIKTSWTRTSVTATAPTNAAYAYVELDWTTTVGKTLTVDRALFENSAFALDYFSGSTGPAEVGSLFWEASNTNYGRSHLYRNRVATQNRLVNGGLRDFVPLGSTFALYLAQPQT